MKELKIPKFKLRKKKAPLSNFDKEFLLGMKLLVGGNIGRKF